MTRQTSMPYVRLGNSGLKVSKIILGAMSYGSPEWQAWVLGEKEGIEHIKAAYEAGIQTFDTANVYSNGASEVILGKAIKELKLPRDEIVIMTKVYGVVAHTPEPVRDVAHADQNGYINQHGLSRKHIFESVKHSLERLQLDYIDVLQWVLSILRSWRRVFRPAYPPSGHRFDTETPISETMQALHDVVQAGYVRYIGMSSCYAWQFHAMQDYAIHNKLTPFISMQNHYSLVYREEEREMFPTLKYFGVGAIPWSPLGRGLLTRPLREQQTKRGETDFFLNSALKPTSSEEVVNRVEEIAKKKGITMAQVALAWCMSKPGVTAPIVGTTSLKNLHELIDAVNMTLTEDEIKRLEEPYLPQPVIGHS